MEFSIGDFAASLMKGGGIAKSSPSPSVSPPSFSQQSEYLDVQSPDVSNVDVPDSFISNLVTEDVSKIEEDKKEQTIKEEPVSSSDPILLEIRDLLVSLQSQINEMTSVGMVGVNLAGCSKSDEEEEEKEETTKQKIERILRGAKK